MNKKREETSDCLNLMEEERRQEFQKERVVTTAFTECLLKLQTKLVALLERESKNERAYLFFFSPFLLLTLTLLLLILLLVLAF